MRGTPEFDKKFLVNSDDTGRFIVKSYKTGKTYYIEPIGGRAEWGDLNPATGKVEGSYGDKYKGSINKNESLITPENGFDPDKTYMLGPGESPLGYIDMLENNI